MSSSAMSGSSSSSTSNASAIGTNFVYYYYTQMNENPKELHHFYKENSVFVRGEDVEDEETQQVTGIENINKKIQSLGLENSSVEIRVADYQNSFNGILVVVIGYLTLSGSSPRKFVQTFFLAPQTSPKVGFYVQNDVFRYLNGGSENSMINQGMESSSSNPSVSSEQNFSHDSHAVVEPRKQEAEQKIEVSEPKVEHPKEPIESDIRVVQPRTAQTSSPSPSTSQVASIPPQQATGKTSTSSSHSSASNSTAQTTSSSQPPASPSTKKASKGSPRSQHATQQQSQSQPTSSPFQSTPSSQSSTPSAPSTWASITSRIPQGDKTSPVPSNPSKTWSQPAVSPQQTSAATASSSTSTPNSVEPMNKPSTIKGASNRDKSDASGLKDKLKEGFSLYVRNLPFSVTEEQIRKAFSDSGEIRQIVLQAHKGYCFIEYGTPEAVLSVIRNAEASPKYMEGRELTIEEKKTTKADKKFKDPKKRGDRGDRGDRADRPDRGDRPPKPRSGPTSAPFNGNVRSEPSDKAKPKRTFQKENTQL